MLKTTIVILAAVTILAGDDMSWSSYETDWWYGVVHKCNHSGAGFWPICPEFQQKKQHHG